MVDNSEGNRISLERDEKIKEFYFSAIVFVAAIGILGSVRDGKTDILFFSAGILGSMFVYSIVKWLFKLPMEYVSGSLEDVKEDIVHKFSSFTALIIVFLMLVVIRKYTEFGLWDIRFLSISALSLLMLFLISVYLSNKIGNYVGVNGYFVSEEVEESEESEGLDWSKEKMDRVDKLLNKSAWYFMVFLLGIMAYINNMIYNDEIISNWALLGAIITIYVYPILFWTHSTACDLRKKGAEKRKSLFREGILGFSALVVLLPIIALLSVVIYYIESSVISLIVMVFGSIIGILIMFILSLKLSSVLFDYFGLDKESDKDEN